MQFWVEWELWQKMCSVLGCLIIIVLIYGFGVLCYNKWTLKKYAAVEEQEKMEGKILDMEDEGKDNIPFGARAIESGIQIDGIWISGPNTPSNSPGHPGTPIGSRRASSTIQTNSRETLKPPPIRVTACDDSSFPSDTFPSDTETQGLQPRLIARVPSGVFDVNRLSAEGEHLKRNETLELERSRRDYAAYQTYLQPGGFNPPADRPTTPFAMSDEEKRISSASSESPAGFEGNFKFQQYSDSSERLIQSPSRPEPAQHLNSKSSGENIKLNPVQDLPFDENRPGDLDSLRTHRLSHVAETGQLGSERNGQAKLGGYDQGVPLQELVAKLTRVMKDDV